MVEIEPGLMMERIEGEPSMERPERPTARPTARPNSRPAPTARPERRETPKPVREEQAEKPAYSGKPPRIVEDDAPAPRMVAAGGIAIRPRRRARTA